MSGTCRDSLRSRNPDEGIDRAAPVGYTYYVSDEQLADYGRLSLLERLTWLDQARQVILVARTEQSASRRARLCGEQAAFRKYPRKNTSQEGEGT
jgi:hypothetical protein